MFENGTYEANGSLPIPGRDRVDFSALARAAGYRKSCTFDDLGAFEAGIASVLREAGPLFVTLKVEPGIPPNYDYALMHAPHLRQQFKAALNG